MSSFFEGKKTYTGILIIIAGWIGIGEIINDGNAALIIDNVLQLVGIVVAIYGRFYVKKTV